MGGDNAPDATLHGALEALKAWQGLSLHLVGDKALLEALMSRPGFGWTPELMERVNVVHAGSVVTFEDAPKVILKEKKDSSIRVAAQLVRDGEADGMVSMGHTGAAMMASTLVIGKLEGVERPGLASLMPNLTGSPTVFMEVGANIDSRAEHIACFGLMASVYAEKVLGIANPRVGILSVGEEDSKGTDITREAAVLLRQMGLNFIGNAEGRDIWNGRFDVIACDGFVGNIVLKSAEGMAKLIKDGLRIALASSLKAKVGALLVKPALQEFFKQLDYREYGGLPLLGIKGVSVIGHGSSDAHAVRNAIGAALRSTEHGINKRIQAHLAKLAPKA